MTLRVANAPCSWGALEFDWAGPAPSYSRVLDEMAASGYSGTELGDWGFLPTDPVPLRDELARRSLTLLGAFVPVRLSVADDHEAGVQAAVRVGRLMASAADAPFIVLSDATARDPLRTRIAGRVGPDDGLSPAQWDVVARGAQAIARRVREETGLRTVFHHHCATFVETPLEIDALMTRTDASLVGLCLDTGHAAFGGGNPLALARAWRDRIWHVHLKDCEPRLKARAVREEWDYPRSVREGIFCELGHGDVDFPAVVDELRRAGYDGWLVVEQDVLPSLGSPLESARRNRQYLRTLNL